MKKIFFAFISFLIVNSAVFCGVVYYDDPLAVGIGARPIGMGRAFVAIADDGNAIFMNPSGLATQNKWHFSSMSTNFMNEYQYTMLSGVYPTPDGVYGLGYVSSQIGDIITDGGGTADFYNQAFVFSYGRYVGDIWKGYMGGERNLYAGANLKYYSKGFGGDVTAAGAGYNFDLGLKYVPEKWISYGLTVQNVLMGSKIGGDFEPEDMPSVVKVGAAFYWLEHDVKFALDKDMFIGRSVPWPMHFGVEYRAHQYLVLRAGLDQVAGSSGGGDISTNTTFGVGLEYNGFRVDLSYMSNFAEADISSSILSISFYGEAAVKEKKIEAPPVKKAAPLPTELIAKKVVIEPADKISTFNKEVAFTGRVEPDITEIWIDGVKAELQADGLFKQTLPLAIGKNEKPVRIVDASGAEATIYRRIARFYLPAGMTKEEAEVKLFEEKVILSKIYNYLVKDYSMQTKISRELLALVISEAKKLEYVLPSEQVSKDVNNTYWAAPYIFAVKAAGIMSDNEGGNFTPHKNVTRAELAVYMARATGGNESSILQYLGSKPLNEDATFEDLVSILYHSGVLSGAIDEYKDFLGMGKATI